MFLQYSAFSIRIHTSLWRALPLISAWILQDTMRRKMANCSRLVPPRLETHDHQSSSASITEWEAPPCLMIEVTIENLRRPHEWAQQISVRWCSTMLAVKASTARRYAILHGTRNQWRSQSDCTSEPSRLVARQRVVQTEVHRATRWQTGKSRASVHSIQLN